MLELSNLCHCFQHPQKLTSWGFWSSRNESKPFSKQKCVLRKWCAESQKQWMLELSNLCHCVQHPWDLTSWGFWSSRNERKPFSKQKCVLRKWCGESQKQWMLELSNLCHCVQHPQKHTSRGFWSPRNERKSFSKQKCVLRKWCRVSQKSKCWRFQTFAIVFSTPKNLLVEISGALGTKERNFLSKNVFWENAVGYLRNGEC